MRRAQAGDREAFAELMRTHGDAVRQLVRRFVRNSDDARDVEQDAWLRAATHLDSLRDQGRFRPWLRTIARNASLTFLSSRSQSARDTSFDECDAEAFEDPAAETPERYVLSRDSQRKVWEALGALSERDRTALFLREYQEQPYEEIAKRLGVSRNAAEVCVFRARERFRRIFLDVEERQAPCGFDAFRLSSMVERDVPAEVRQEVELHLASCEPCAERLTTMSAGQALYRNLGMFGFPIPGAMGLMGRITDLIARIAGLLGGGGTTGGAGMSTAASATATTATTASAVAVVGAVSTASAITGLAAASAIALGVVFSQAVPPAAAQPLPVSQAVAVSAHASGGAFTPVALSASFVPGHGVAADDGSDVPGPSSSDAVPVGPVSASLPPLAPAAQVLPLPPSAVVPPVPATPEQASPPAETGAEQDLPGDDSIDGPGLDGNNGDGNGGSNGENANGGNGNNGNGNANNGNANNGNGNGSANGGNAYASNANANGGNAYNGNENGNANNGNGNRGSANGGNAYGGNGNNGNGNGNANGGNANGGNASNANASNANASNANANGGNANSGHGNSGDANGGNAYASNANGGNASNANANGGNASNAHANSANRDVPRGNSKDSLVLDASLAAGLGGAVVAGPPVPDGAGQAQAAAQDEAPPVELPSHEVKESPHPADGSAQAQGGGNAVGLSIDVTGSGGRDARSSGSGANGKRTGQRGR